MSRTFTASPDAAPTSAALAARGAIRRKRRLKGPNRQAVDRLPMRGLPPTLSLYAACPRRSAAARSSLLAPSPCKSIPRGERDLRAVHFAILDRDRRVAAAAAAFDGARERAPILTEREDLRRTRSPQARDARPAGTSRSQTATCGRSFTAFDEMVTLAGVSPGEVASTVMFPADFVDCTRAMQRPQKALRELPLSDSWLVGSPLPTPITLPCAGDPEAHLVIGHRARRGPARPAPPPRTSRRPRHRPKSPLRSAVSTSFAAGPVVSRFAVITCLPSL